MLIRRSSRFSFSAGRLATGVLVIAAIVSGLGVVAVHLRHIKEVSGEYRWTAVAAPPLLEFEGRHYGRSSPAALLIGDVALGQTAGGGVIYGPAAPHPYALTGLRVVVGGQVTGYALSGGP